MPGEVAETVERAKEGGRQFVGSLVVHPPVGARGRVHLGKLDLRAEHPQTLGADRAAQGGELLALLPGRVFQHGPAYRAQLAKGVGQVAAQVEMP